MCRGWSKFSPQLRAQRTKIKYKENYPRSEAFSVKEEESNGSLISMVDGVNTICTYSTPYTG